MIIGAHSIIYSADPQKDRDFFRKVLKFPYVDIGDGWLIFKLPPSELAIHPSELSGSEEFYLLCDNVEELYHEMNILGFQCGKPERQSWGLLTYVMLPGGGKLKIYQPMHDRPE